MSGTGFDARLGFQSTGNGGAMGITSVEIIKIRADIGDHRHRVARLLEDVDTLRRSVAEFGVANHLTGRMGTTLDLCTSRIQACDVALGEVAAHLECGPSSPSDGIDHAHTG
jgi:hypothetical protein